jgi:heme exporter protein A
LSVTAPDSPLLVVHSLERRFGALVALRGVSFAVGHGEVVLLLGPNGAGKSTLLRCIAGLARPTKGRVTVADLRVHGDPDARRQLGLLSHHSYLYEDLTARENLRFAAELHGLDSVPERVEHALADARLTSRADSRVFGFSRGMMQRLAIARATLHQPPLLLLDEPFTSLDVAASEELRERVRRERNAGRTVLCVTHEPGELWAVTTRVIVIRGGEVVTDEARPDDLEAFRVHYNALVAG